MNYRKNLKNIFEKLSHEIMLPKKNKRRTCDYLIKISREINFVQDKLSSEISDVRLGMSSIKSASTLTNKQSLLLQL